MQRRRQCGISSFVFDQSNVAIARRQPTAGETAFALVHHFWLEQTTNDKLVKIAFSPQSDCFGLSWRDLVLNIEARSDCQDADDESTSVNDTVSEGL